MSEQTNPQPETDEVEDKPAEVTHPGHIPPPVYVPVAEGQTNQPEGTVVEPPTDDSEVADDGEG